METVLEGVVMLAEATEPIAVGAAAELASQLPVP